MNKLVKTISTEGKFGRDAQNEAQSLAVLEFMDDSYEEHLRYRLMVNYATGVGKGKTAIEAATEFYDRVSKNQLFIGCFTEKQRDVIWPTQLATWGKMHHIMANNRRECYASMHNIKGQHFGLVILDEVQHLTELSYSFFENNTYDGILLLTATEPRDPEKKKIIKRLTYGRRLIIKADSAIDSGMINDYEVYVVELEPDKTEMFKMQKNTNTLYNEYTGYLKKCQLLTHAKKSGNPVRIKFAAIDRKRYLGNCKSKTQAAKYIQQRFRDKEERFITISSSIKQCNELGQYVFHSETNDTYYKQFLYNKIDELISVNTIKEGENFENLGRCLVVQADKDPNVFTQIRGRVSRLPIGMVSRIFLLCLMGTQDETYVRDALSDTDPNKVKRMKLDKSVYWNFK